MFYQVRLHKFAYLLMGSLNTATKLLIRCDRRNFEFILFGHQLFPFSLNCQRNHHVRNLPCRCALIAQIASSARHCSQAACMAGAAAITASTNSCVVGLQASIAAIFAYMLLVASSKFIFLPSMTLHYSNGYLPNLQAIQHRKRSHNELARLYHQALSAQDQSYSRQTLGHGTCTLLSPPDGTVWQARCGYAFGA